ncbi:MAG: hypothetical protein ABI378_06675 [Chitinophagaceae bacterium]
MKQYKNFFTISIVILSILVITSCKKNNNPPNPSTNSALIATIVQYSPSGSSTTDSTRTTIEYNGDNTINYYDIVTVGGTSHIMFSYQSGLIIKTQTEIGTPIFIRDSIIVNPVGLPIAKYTQSHLDSNYDLYLVTLYSYNSLNQLQQTVYSNFPIDSTTRPDTTVLSWNNGDLTNYGTPDDPNYFTNTYNNGIESQPGDYAFVANLLESGSVERPNDHLLVSFSDSTSQPDTYTYTFDGTNKIVKSLVISNGDSTISSFTYK